MIIGLEFDADKHEYRKDGTRVPSVTQILKPLSDFSGIPAHILERKRQIGTAVHLACELYDADELDEESLSPTIKGYFDGWVKFRVEHTGEIEMCEQRVFSEMHQYAGTLDRVMIIDGKQSVVDIKTSAELSPTTGVQLAAYDMALGRGLIDRYAVQLKPDGTYRLEKYTDNGDYAVFLSLLTIQNWRNRHEK